MASEMKRVQSNTTSLYFLYTNYSRGFAHVVLSDHIKFRIKDALSGLRQFLAFESPLKLMKYTFISPSKFFLFSRYLIFCLVFLFM